MLTKTEQEKVLTLVKQTKELIFSEMKSEEITVKGAADYVTNVDFAVQDFLKTELGRLFPQIQMVAEEKENNNLEKSGTDYLKDKTIALNKLEISIEEEKNKVTVSCEGKSGPLIARILNKKSIGTSSSVKKGAPDDFIRMVNAVRNALE